MTRAAARRLGFALTAILVAAAADAAERALPLWQIDGAENSVYLLGSIHLLRESDYPIPEAIYEAYEDAEVLVMELDMDDFDPALVSSLVSELGVLPEGGSLESILGPEAYATAEDHAAAADLPLSRLTQLEPWYAAITVEQLVLRRLGFDPEFGIESHLAARAAADDKSILGLETIRQQLELLDGLSIDAQRAMLLETLAQSLELGGTMDELVRAWRNGDLDYLERVILEDFRKHPELYEALVVERNEAWADRIEGLLGGNTDDYLVVVGALHLIGEDGVPGVLARRGHPARQLEQRPAEPL